VISKQKEGVGWVRLDDGGEFNEGEKKWVLWRQGFCSPRALVRLEVKGGRIQVEFGGGGRAASGNPLAGVSD